MTVTPVKVLYEDKDFIVFDKPSGLLVIPSPHKTQQTLVQLANEQCRSQPPVRLYPCHRLDRETSGVIIFAKGKKNQQSLMRDFEQKRIDKTYTAFVRGRLNEVQGLIQKPVFDYHERKFARRPQARSAVTRYRVIDERRGFSVVEAVPLTGRTNQIRIHFKLIGHPLLGERIYAFGKDFSVKFRRLALHAAEISFRHPVTGKNITVASPLPEDMKNFLEKHNERNS